MPLIASGDWQSFELTVSL